MDEIALARTMFGDAIHYDTVNIHNHKWWPFQPQNITMAPDGHLWFHPKGNNFCANFCDSPLHLQAHFIHEMTHVWQVHEHGRYWLILMRHPFCRYEYVIEDGKPFWRYGIEQQAEIVRHAFLMRHGIEVPNKPPLMVYDALLPFHPIMN